MEGIFFKTPLPPLWKFQLSFIQFFIFFCLTEPPTPLEIPIPSVGEYGYFLELHIIILLLKTPTIFKFFNRVCEQSTIGNIKQDNGCR